MPLPSQPYLRAALGMLGLLLFSTAGTSACKRQSDGRLRPPDDAPAWESRYRSTFDDDFTSEPINLTGRAPHDVLDQRLLAARLGYAHLVMEVRVDQVWAKGSYAGKQDQYLDIEIQNVLMGQLPKGTDLKHSIAVIGEDELVGNMQGQALLMFLRWAPEQEPPYHHHLMPTDPTAMNYVRALIDHAKEEGVLDDNGVPVEAGRSRRRRRQGRDGGGE